MDRDRRSLKTNGLSMGKLVGKDANCSLCNLPRHPKCSTPLCSVCKKTVKRRTKGTQEMMFWAEALSCVEIIL